MSAQITDRSRLIVDPHTAISRPIGQIELATKDAIYTLRGRAASDLDAAIRYIDGSMELGEVARRAEIDLNPLIATLEQIGRDGFTDIGPAVEAETPEDFLDVYYRICDAWAGRIFDCPLWNDLRSGNACVSMVWGWCLEFFHRVCGADEHNAISLNFCPDGKLRAWMKDHYDEEYGHSDIFLSGLYESGFASGDVARSEPLPTTKDLINFLNTLAAANTVAYLGCYGIMHSPRVGQTRELIDEQFNSLISMYPFAARALGRIHEHARLDVTLGHDEIIFDRFCRSKPVFSESDVARIFHAARGITLAFSAFFDGIHAYYGASGAVVPRGPIRSVHDGIS